MAIENIIIWIILGGVAGWLAEKVVGADHGIITNIVVGIIGAFIGGFLFDALEIAGDVDGLNIGSLVVAFVGAVVLLLVLKFLRR